MSKDNPISLDPTKFEIEKAGGVATVNYTDDDAYYSSTDIEKSVLKNVNAHNSNYVEACAKAGSDIATKIMAKDKSIDVVHVKLPYGISKRGHVDVNSKRSVTYPGMNGRDPVTRSDVRVVVKDPMSTMGKSKLKELQAKMTETLLG